MKNILKKITALILIFPVKIILFRKRPEVIAITGSAGKTSTKEFIKEILNEDFHVLAPMEGYNTEIGAPLSLFREKAPVKIFSPLAWLKILIKIYCKALFLKDFEEKVVIEMGADKPGDIKFLAKIFRPQKAVVLTVLPVHLEEFKTIEAIADEKSKLAKIVGENGIVFLNYDDPRVREMASKVKANVVFFGAGEGADIRAENLKANLSGITFNLLTKNEKTQIKAPLYGRQMVYPLLAAISVSLYENISVSKVKESVKRLRPFKGRMNIIEGKNDTVIIDDSYNANPASMIESLNFLGEQKGRRIAALGNMNELGSFEREGHEMVGRHIPKSADLLVTVGEVAEKYLAKEAISSGMKKAAVKSFLTSEEAGDYLSKNIKPGDVILAKGSQNKVRMEKAVAKIMAHPKKREDILVRQSGFWQDR